MKHVHILLWGKYAYDVNVQPDASIEDVALQLSLEVHKKENKTKFTEHPRTYDYILECLKTNKSCVNFRSNVEHTIDNANKFLEMANQLNAPQKFTKKVCECNITGQNFCKKCNNHGFFYERTEYRVGYTQSNTLIIDLDSKNIGNLILVTSYYEKLLDVKFTTIETRSGFWLISDKKYITIDDWVFANCCVLYPRLVRENMGEYIEELLSIDETNQGFRPTSAKEIKLSNYYAGVGEFDVRFQFLSIKRKKCTIRYTKKRKDDEIRLLLST